MKKPMLCNKCSKMIVCHCFTTTNCSICNTEIKTSHMPGDTVCRECAETFNYCQKCGKELKKTTSYYGPCLSGCGNTTRQSDGICLICKKKMDNVR